MNPAHIQKTSSRSPFYGMLSKLWPARKERWLKKLETGEISSLYVSPKIDGVRCTAMIDTLFSRNGFFIPTLSHIRDDVHLILRNKYLSIPKESIVLDGELYGEDKGRPLGEILGNVIKRRESIDFKTFMLEQKISLYLFDVYFKNRPRMPYAERLRLLHSIYQNSIRKDNITNVFVLPSQQIVNNTECEAYLRESVQKGYEGIVVRSAQGLYLPGKRSDHVLKYLYYHKEVCQVCSIIEGSGSMRQSVGSVICETSAGKRYHVNFSLCPQARKMWWEKREKLKKCKILVKTFARDEGEIRFASVSAILDQKGSRIG